ncbi:MAG: NAD(P)H-dependent oxidoreductase [Actinobacteria bacterium]|nr:NAD(P)H-dependent oxidoreductase [Actinomycetota bacterium]
MLLVSGSLRSGSTNGALLNTAAALTLPGITTTSYRGLADLPHFNPDDDRPDAPLDPAVRELRAILAASDAVLFSTPEYAGGLPGSFKNLLDWTVGGGETYGMPVAWINTAGPAAPSGGADAEAELARVLGYTGAEIVAAACRRIPVAREAIGADGLIADPAIRDPLAEALRTLAAAVADGAAARHRVSASG